MRNITHQEKFPGNQFRQICAITLSVSGQKWRTGKSPSKKTIAAAATSDGNNPLQHNQNCSLNTKRYRHNGHIVQITAILFGVYRNVWVVLYGVVSVRGCDGCNDCFVLFWRGLYSAQHFLRLIIYVPFRGNLWSDLDTPALITKTIMVFFTFLPPDGQLHTSPKPLSNSFSSSTPWTVAHR